MSWHSPSKIPHYQQAVNQTVQAHQMTTAISKEFMNRVDKSLQRIYNASPLPVILVDDSRTLGFYEQVCDNPSIILGRVDNLPHLKDGNAQEIIDGVQKLVENQRKTRYETAQGELEKSS